jgi:hypothetical protein
VHRRRAFYRFPPWSIARPYATTAIQAALLEKFGPATVVVDANERIVYFRGDPEAYLVHPSGENRAWAEVRAPRGASDATEYRCTPECRGDLVAPYWGRGAAGRRAINQKLCR